MNLLKKFLSLCKTDGSSEDHIMKYLIVGLGNVGEEYEGTRHNCGFMVVDAMVKEAGASWSLERHAYRAEIRLKGRTVVLIKPTTYMNLSGKAVRYWMGAEKVDMKNLLVVVDDLALPVGTMRMKKQGSSGGHNGLSNIEALIGSAQYCRLRIGIGSEFTRGHQIDYVLGRFTSEEQLLIDPLLPKAVAMVQCFVEQGADRAMNQFN